MNKAELARALEISLPTLGAWLADDPHFPALARGKVGTAWQFDLAAVRHHLAERKHDPANSLDDQIKLARLQAMRLAAAEKAGVLAPLAQMQDTLATLFAGMAADSVSFVNRQAREQGWPPAVKAAELRRLADLQRSFVARAPALLEGLTLAPVTIGED